jgi:hypothetical protein
MVFNTAFNNISDISVSLEEETGVSRENPLPAGSHRDIFQLYGEKETFHISLLLMRAINRKMNTLHTRKKA